MTYKTATGETPFLLAYGTEAVVPSEVGAKSVQVQYFNPTLNDEGLTLNGDLLKEIRGAICRIIQQKQRVARYFNTNVKRRSFQLNSFILRKAEFIDRERRMGKLAANWERP